MITLDELRALGDDAFNRAIAEALGVRVQKHPEGGYTVRFPGGTANAVRPERIDWDLGACIPDYATDLNASWALPITDQDVDVTIYSYCNTLLIEVQLWRENVPGREDFCFEAAHVQPARALATAWYAWKLAQEARDE